jgi:hypothetical protein
MMALLRHLGRSLDQLASEATKKFLKWLRVNFTICAYCAMRPARRGSEFCSEECEHSSRRNERLYGGEK